MDNTTSQPTMREMVTAENALSVSDLISSITEIKIHLPNLEKYLQAAISKLCEKLSEYFNAVSIHEVAHELQNMEDLWENTELHIGVTGETGAGKSSFINAMRGLKPGDVGAAKVGVTETTKEPHCYENPNNPSVKFWDLPGIGAPGFRPEDYLQKVNFHRYDFFIIIGSKRFRDIHVDLALEIEKKKKMFYFVRTKVDEDLTNMKRDHPETDEGKVLKIIRDDSETKIQANTRSFTPQVFLLSSCNLNRFDFNRLIETLEKDLPGLKKLKFILCLPNVSPDIIQRKKQELKEELWKISLISAFINAIPIQFYPVAFNAIFLQKKMMDMYKMFGLDSDSLVVLAGHINKPVQKLKDEIKSSPKGNICIDYIIHKCIHNIENVCKPCFPVNVLIRLAKGGLSCASTYIMLSKFLDEVAEDAERVSEEALKDVRCDMNRQL